MPAALTQLQTDTWAAHYAQPSGHRWWPCEELVRAVAGRDLGDVLEVGCGNGANLWFLASKTIGAVVGLDFNEDALAAARAYMRERGCGGQARDSRPGHRVWNTDVHLVKGAITRLPFPDASFDSLVDCMTSQHVRWDAHAPLYREYARVLRPGGWLFLYHLTNRTTGGQMDPEGADVPQLALFPKAGLTCLPGAGALERAVTDAGFCRTQRTGMLREYPAGSVAHYAVVTAHKGR